MLAPENWRDDTVHMYIQPTLQGCRQPLQGQGRKKLGRISLPGNSPAGQGNLSKFLCREILMTPRGHWARGGEGARCCSALTQIGPYT